MRSHLFICTLALCSTGFAQTNFPFPDSAAVWSHYYQVMVLPPPIPTFEVQSRTNFCMSGADTMIDAVSYTKLEHCAGGYIGGFRNSGERVFFYPADSIQEYLLYDFGAQVGDTVFDVYIHQSLTMGVEWIYGSYLTDLVVDQIDSTNISGGRKVLYFGGGQYIKWIEGIGNGDGLFALTASNVSGFQFGIECMSYLDTVRIRMGDWFNEPGTCTPVYIGVNELNHDVFSLTASPNPTNGLVTLTTDLGPKSQLLILDQLGRVLEAPVRHTSGTIEVDLSNLPQGLYFAQLITAAETKTIRIMRGPEQ